MVLLREAQVGSPQPLTERQILSEVLGERRGHVRGVGRKIGSSSSSASQSSVQSRPAERLYTQAEVDAMMTSQHSRLQEEVRANQNNTQAIYEALVRAGITVNLPSSSQRHDHDEEPRDDSDD